MILDETLARQRAAFETSAPPTADERRSKLKALRKGLCRYQDVFADAAAEDFGERPAFESRLIEVIGSIWVIDHAIRNVGKWMRPDGRSPELMFAGPNTLKVTYQPKGVVGIVTPWNMPLYLSAGPLAAALAAGNRAMIKLPEDTPRSNAVIRKILAEVFDATEVAAFGEEIADPSAFTALPFDHLIFTGSARIGRLVMAAAAKNLTPVTLELGGKSPAIVAEDYSIDDAALRIVHGKIALSGQVCVAPDYALVPEKSVDAFAAAAKKAFNTFYPNGVNRGPDYCGIINQRHRARLTGLMEDAKRKGAQVNACADYDGGAQMPLHVVTGISEDMQIAEEEIFGPILPVIPYHSLDDAIAYVKRKPRPLALYAFSTDGAAKKRILNETHSGGVTFNDWGWHVVNASVPFGGVGHSGFGSYHGVEGFRELSKARPVFTRHPLFPTQLFYPPVNKGPRGVFQNVAMDFYVGKGDSALGGTPYGAMRKKPNR